MTREARDTEALLKSMTKKQLVAMLLRTETPWLVSDLVLRIQKYRSALERIQELPSLPEQWNSDLNQLTYAYPKGQGPWEIARDTLEAEIVAEDGC
jgi:hypothetical protein